MTGCKWRWKSEYGGFLLFAACTVRFSLLQDLIRPHYSGDCEATVYHLGVLPNFFPAIGQLALFIIVLPYFSFGESRPKGVHENLHIIAMIITAGGLIAWEFQQHFTPNGVFDWHDVLWTLVGTGYFYLIWRFKRWYVQSLRLS